MLNNMAAFLSKLSMDELEAEIEKYNNLEGIYDPSKSDMKKILHVRSAFEHELLERGISNADRKVTKHE